MRNYPAMVMRNYSAMVAQRKATHGDKFDESALDKRFVPYFESGERIKVRTLGLMIITGTVGVTTGWCPCFLLMRMRRGTGSAFTLGPNDDIVAVKHGKTWRTP